MNESLVGVFETVVDATGIEGGKRWIEEQCERDGTWVPQHAFRSIPSMLMCRITPCHQ